LQALIVEDGLSRQVLAGARALEHAGWTVGVASPLARSAATASRSVARWHPVPAPEHDLAGFVEAVGEAADRYAVVFGARDLEVAALSRFRDRIPATVPYPRHEAVVRAQDKLALTRAAESLGFAVPATMEVGTSGMGPLRLPAVIKPRVGPALGRGVELGRLPERVAAAEASDLGTARQLAAEIEAAGDEALAQEMLDGQLAALVTVADRSSRPLGFAQQLADRSWPRGIGISVRARTTEVSSRLVGRATALLSELGCYGIVQLQFLISADGEARLIDLTGRFYGSMALAGSAGLNLAAAWADLAVGREPRPLPRARVGTRYQWLWGDLRRAVTEPRRHRTREVLGSLRYALTATHSVWSRRDPRPTVSYLASRVRRRAARRR
jgi:predicted ATP-grasp superfamily ATP-dependent carboligase